MQPKYPSTIDRLGAEVEQTLAKGMAVAKGMACHDLRQACAVARGYLELARYYDEPLHLEDVERVLAQMRAMLRAETSMAAKDDDSEGLESVA